MPARNPRDAAEYEILLGFASQGLATSSQSVIAPHHTKTGTHAHMHKPTQASLYDGVGAIAPNSLIQLHSHPRHNNALQASSWRGVDISTCTNTLRWHTDAFLMNSGRSLPIQHLGKRADPGE